MAQIKSFILLSDHTIIFCFFNKSCYKFYFKSYYRKINGLLLNKCATYKKIWFFLVSEYINLQSRTLFLCFVAGRWLEKTNDAHKSHVDLVSLNWQKLILAQIKLTVKKGSERNERTQRRSSQNETNQTTRSKSCDLFEMQSPILSKLHPSSSDISPATAKTMLAQPVQTDIPLPQSSPSTEDDLNWDIKPLTSKLSSYSTISSNQQRRRRLATKSMPPSLALRGRQKSISRDIGHAACETYLITRLTFKLLIYLGYDL